MISLKFKLLLFLIFLNFIGCLSVNPIPSEYNCLSTLIQDYNLLKFTKDTNNQYVDICTTANTDIVCTTNLNIKTLALNSGGTDNILDPLNFVNCFPQMDELIVKNLKVTPNFIYYKFPAANTVRYSNISGILGGITQPLPAYRLIELFSDDLNNTIFRMQYLDKVTYSLNMFSSDSYYYLNTDGANSDESSILTNFRISLNSISDLSSYKKLRGVTFKISPRFDYSTISFLKKLQITDQSGMLTIYDTFNQNATLDQYIFDNSIIPYIYVSAIFKKPKEFFDITLFKNHTYKSITLVPGTSFNINGSFPLIVPKNIEISFIGGYLTVFPNNLNFNPDITTNFQNSIKSEQFPPFLGSGGSFDFTGTTKFTGTIDKSWCTTEIAVSLGNLTGLVPSCFACYFNVTTVNSYSKLTQKSMFSRFASNKFSNFNTNTPCTTFRPKVELINDGIFNKVMVTGNDIGFDVTLWKINLTISLDPTTYVINQNGKNYTATMVGANNNLKNVEYFPVLFTTPNNVTYTFPTNYNIPPIIKSVLIKSTGNEIQVSGTHFSSYLGFTNQQVQIQNVGNCSTITSSDFFGAQCTMESGKQLPISNSTIPLQIISIEKDSFNVKAYIKIESNFDNNQVCPNDCSTSVGVNSICDLSSGTCKCLPGFIGSDCLGIECSVPDCSGNGYCNTTIGECICDSSHRGSDCSILFIECDPLDCNSNGVCDTTKGECNCKENSWSGPTCLIPYHYITSTIPSTTNGGVASFIGFFGDTHNNLSITIGNLPCPLLYNSTTVLNCTAPPGFGVKLVVVTQNNITYSYDKYQYLNINNQTCPNKCSNQGTCNTLNGQCKCNNGFNGADCSGIINPGGGNNGGSNSDSDGGNNGNPPTDTGVDPGTGNTTISNQEVQFQIFFKSLYEIDFNGNIVATYSLRNNWTTNSTNSKNEIIYTLSQTIQSNCSIISKIEEITNRNGKEYTFADETFNLQYGSIKFSIGIYNYSYKNNLNTLKLELVSSVDQINSDDNECNEMDTSINTINNKDGESTFNYIKISKNNKILEGRFINKLVSDGRPTYLLTSMKNESKDSISISLDLPHCIESCIIDPDFSVLISPEFKNECGNSKDGRKSYVIPVAVVASVVGVSAIGAIGFLIYRKKGESVLLNKLKKINK
ncbi:hypothetical protein DDB_G0276959 [Dictyostelium discoideum AX4]|uniref:EGF-like domain-containing protein n=1 Tax=Dictyostelium discoideum TaxID=44689 RepID=Q86KF0_DICDI|nr:hypothetical protein DDB_G0276959 [Dictyostelium discoideum AX4]EAL68981.1 hypothetical protein DDB_G0276959 [Dictyostelium discoideum AX4]|eukprot:XP_642990.1 hypothetical protein DDB_G0276959 [Dictyostelium discoideum AX4]